MNRSYAWSVLHQQDWLANHEPKKLHTLFAMLISVVLVLFVVWRFPVSVRVMCVYQVGIMVVIFAHFFSYLKVWKDVYKKLPNLTEDDRQLMFAYTTRCYATRAFFFSMFWPIFFLPRSSRKCEYER